MEAPLPHYSKFNGNSRILYVWEYVNNHMHTYDVVRINCLYVKYAYLIIIKVIPS